MIGPALRVLIVLAVAAANHIALSLPSPEFTIWEKELLKDVRARSPSQQTLWMKSGLCASKVIIWLSATYELVGYALMEHSSSSVGRDLHIWLSPMVLDTIRDTISATSIQTSCGALLISLGALLHISAHRSLGDLSYYPVIARSSAVGRQLYVPPASAHTYDALGRAQLDEKSLKVKSPVQWTLRTEHGLLQTGPYRLVRHPMYAGALLALAGSVLICLAPGSPTRNIARHFDRSSFAYMPAFAELPDIGRRVAPAWAAVLAKTTWAGFAGFALGLAFGCALVGVVFGLVRLARREDEALGTRFGHQWTVYRWSVRAYFLPGLL